VKDGQDKKRSHTSLNLEMALAACFEKNLLTEKQARYIFERSKIQRAKIIAQSSEVEGDDPATIIHSFEFSPPFRENEPLEPMEIVEAIAAKLNVPTIHIDPLKLDSEAIVKSLPRAFAFKHASLVLDPKSDPAPVAMANPTDFEALHIIRARLGKRVRIFMAPAGEILHLIREIYGFKTSVAAAEKDLSSLPDIQNLEQFFSMRSESDVDVSDSHIVRAVDHLLRYAFDQRASDIHIEPKREQCVVRLRIDGVLHTVHTFSRRVHSGIVSRIKTLARMDIAEKRLPQDGRIKTQYGQTNVELRVSTLPVAFGEKAVLRIFDPILLEKDLSELGLIGRDLELVEGFLARPHGIFLVTGPTGSGKTTTLYTALKKISTEACNVSTVEDPIENICAEFNQVGVQSQIGLSFAHALRTLLRQDPDIIMVGEIRDAETAKMAIQAALTGHLVLSTLHTNNAPGAINRLLDMEVEPFLLSSTLLGVMAQRLVRTPCSNCAVNRLIDPDEAKLLCLPGDTQILAGEGCSRCRRTGYIGRTGIFEILGISKAVADAIHMRASTQEIEAIGRSEGMLTLMEAGVEKVLSGMTTPAEVLRQAYMGESS
jgi:general secretion pathway protein E